MQEISSNLASATTLVRDPATERQRPVVPWIAYVAVVWALCVDYLSTISLGPITISGIATIAVALASVGLFPAYLLARRTGGLSRRGFEPYLPTRLQAPWAPAPLVAFALWAGVVLTLEPTSEGVQNVAVYIAFVAAITATAASSSPRTATRVHQMMVVVAITAGLVALIGALFPPLLVYGDRSFALAALVLLAVTIPSNSRRLLVRFAPALLVLAMVLSLSRTATFVGVLMLPFVVVRRGRISGRSLRLLSLYAVAALMLWLLVTRYPPFRDRFLVGDNYSVGGVDLNTSGRSAIWEGTLESIEQGNLWFGQGPGSAAEFVFARFPPVAHPHNDYLRLWHDFGLVGLSLFAAGYGLLLWRTFRAARRSSPERAGVHWSAFLGLAAVAGAAMTDNVLVYPFVMVPLGVLVGLSVARSRTDPQPREGPASGSTGGASRSRARQQTGKSFTSEPLARPAGLAYEDGAHPPGQGHSRR